ncbi:MAG: hypothetical protein KGZ57_02315 [Dethiobacter sp.]|nr:hypothetical protein [Dethiobacter sp.]
MLGFWRSHEQFHLWLGQRLLAFLPEHEKLIRFYAHILEKVYILNLDRLLPLVSDRYSCTGRPAANQPEIFRALVVMIHAEKRWFWSASLAAINIHMTIPFRCASRQKDGAI